MLRFGDVLVWVGWSDDDSLLIVRGIDAGTGAEVFNHAYTQDVEPRSGTIAGERLLIPAGDQILAFDLTAHTLSDSSYVFNPEGVDPESLEGYFSDLDYRSLTTLDSGDVIAVAESRDGVGTPEINWLRYSDAPHPVWRQDVNNQYGATEAAHPTTLVADDGPFQILSGMYQAYGGFDGPYMLYPWARRFDSTTGEPLDNFFGEFESSGENYAHSFGCMGFVEDDVLATVTSLFPSVYAPEDPDPPFLGILNLWSPQGELLSTQELHGGWCRFGRHPDVGSFITVGGPAEDDAIVSNVMQVHSDGSAVEVVEDTLRWFSGIVVNPDSSIALLQSEPASICRVEIE